MTLQHEQTEQLKDVFIKIVSSKDGLLTIDEIRKGIEAILRVSIIDLSTEMTDGERGTSSMALPAPATPPVSPRVSPSVHAHVPIMHTQVTSGG